MCVSGASGASGVSGYEFWRLYVILAGMNSQANSTDESNSAKVEVSAAANIASAVSEPSAASGNPASANGLQPLSPLPKAGIRTTQFWLLAGVLALVAWMVFAGKLEAGWFAALAPIAAIVYQCVRENLYRDASTHPNDALNQILETVLGQLPTPSGADATAVIAALRHQPTPSQPEEKGGLAPSPQGSPRETGSATTSATLGVLGALGAMLLCLSGCAQTPYYVSGINGTVDTSKDGSRISGGAIGVTISPNPYYPSSSRSLPATKGYAK